MVDEISHLYSMKYWKKMSVDKCVIVIAGIPEDVYFCHICYIVENLTIILKNFNYKKIFKNAVEWKPWLQKICDRWGWSHKNSPLIWRKVGLSKDNVTYIGNVNQFWEFLHICYDINSYITPQDLEKLQLDYFLMYKAVLKSLSIKRPSVKHRYITIIGAGKALCTDLVPQLVTTKELWLTNGVVINLYDEPGCFFKIKHIAKDIEAIGGGLYAARVIESISDGLCDCDILINLEVIPKEENENTDSWLRRNYDGMAKLAKQINRYAPSQMKVLICSMSASCYCVNVLHVLVTKLPFTNIVAVSAHYGLEIIYNLLTTLNVPITNFGCPAVWGFLGINHFVDVCHMIQKFEVYKPNNRALTAEEGTTLPLGFKHPELRWLFYLAHNNNPHKGYFERKAVTQYQIGRTENFQLCKAICDLLQLWYSNSEHIGDEIISLGISSDGSFGIPRGLVFSQPVHLQILKDGSRVWSPFIDFPLPCIPICIFKNLILTAMTLTKERNLKLITIFFNNITQNKNRY
ncbi:hypothetical protein KPH14_011727 [Odynerus spinipes]|uniref:Malate dehydrogenase 1B n=1 Tax=Odynerus spinipes TaxID=1348599 RepID=A0AAD9VUP6_9HYME|nr:hypothetical protein KPH14_011727 [Odynerus spinipes]